MSNWEHPGSKLILPADAPESEWLAERKNGLGGSDLSAILGMNTYSSAYHVWLDKTGRGVTIEESAPMRWGKLHEPTLKRAFTEDMGIEVRSTGLHRSITYPIMQVTPDGFTDDGGVFESKTGSIWQAKHWADDGISDHAALQVMHALMVTGRSHAWVVALIGNCDFHIRRVERDHDMIEDLIGFELAWWNKYVIGDTPPPVTDVALEAIKERFAIGAGEVEAEDPEAVRTLLKELEQRKLEAKKAEIQAKAIEAQLREIAGEHAIVTDGSDPLFTVVNNGTFAPSRFKEKLDPEQVKEVTRLVEALDMDAIKAKYPNEYEACRARVLRSKVK